MKREKSAYLLTCRDRDEKIRLNTKLPTGGRVRVSNCQTDMVPIFLSNSPQRAKHFFMKLRVTSLLSHCYCSRSHLIEVPSFFRWHTDEEGENLEVRSEISVCVNMNSEHVLVREQKHPICCSHLSDLCHDIGGILGGT